MTTMLRKIRMLLHGQRLNIVSLVTVAAIAVALTAALLSNSRVGDFYASVTFDASSDTAHVVQVLDYRFNGGNDVVRIPVHEHATNLQVQPAPTRKPPTIVHDSDNDLLRVTPDLNTPGLYRYMISYDTDDATIPDQAPYAGASLLFGWTGMHDVPNSVRIDIYAPWRWLTPTCRWNNMRGGRWVSRVKCEIDQPQPGHLTIHTSDFGHVDPYISFMATRGEAVPMPNPRPLPPAAEPTSRFSRGDSFVRFGRLALGVCLAAYLLPLIVMKLIGLQRAREDEAPQVHPWQAAVLIRRNVDNTTNAAWLIDALSRHRLIIEVNGKQATIMNGPGRRLTGEPELSSRTRFGAFSPPCAQLRTECRRMQSNWMADGGLFEARTLRRPMIAYAISVVLAVGGTACLLAAAFALDGGAFDYGTTMRWWIPAVALLSAALSVALNARYLNRLTPLGAAALDRAIAGQPEMLAQVGSVREHARRFEVTEHSALTTAWRFRNRLLRAYIFSSVSGLLRTHARHR